VALLSLKTGQLLLVGLRFQGRAATRISVALSGTAPLLTCASTLTDSLIFLGSSSGDSLLVRYTPLGPSASISSSGGAGGGGLPAAKRPKLLRLASGDMGGGVEGGGGGGGGVLRGVPSGDNTWGDGEEEAHELYRAAMGRMGSAMGATGKDCAGRVCGQCTGTYDERTTLQEDVQPMSRSSLQHNMHQMTPRAQRGPSTGACSNL
jgi:hypothetical protein